MQDNNNNGNQNEENNPQIPQPPQLMLQQPQGRSQMNVDQQNQPPVNPANNNQNQSQIQQFQNIMQLHQQRAALTSPQSMQGLHTPPTFAHSQPITSPIHFSNNPYGQFPQQHQPPQVLYPIQYTTAAFGNPQQSTSAPTGNLNSPGAIIDAIAEIMDRGLRESASPGNDIQGISVGAFNDQLQHLSTNRSRNRRKVSKLADAFQFILWQMTTELTAEELDSCRNNNYSIPVSLLGTSVDHTMTENTESKQDQQSHQGQMGGNVNPGTYTNIPTSITMHHPKPHRPNKMKLIPENSRKFC